jgi:ABC-2 type transport system permease protein
MRGGINLQIVRSLVRRDLHMYFNNPTGYVFITLFIFLSAAAAFWQDRFFLNNLANLDRLNVVFPYLLLFFVPALTMSVWSEERKQGTDELLLTLPATDLEIVLGKYLATLGIYTASLVLSLSHVIVLFWLGSPDPGLMIGNYIGYWLVGAALIAIGMLASLLTANTTIAYVLGALFCTLFTALDNLVSIFDRDIGRALTALGVYEHFNDFARGVISFSGILYFLSVIGLLLYLNVLLIGRRHWPPQADGFPMWLHQTVRAVAIGVLLISFGAVVGRASLRLDVTAEQLHSLSDETRRLLRELPDDRPVFIQAYLSTAVPENYVQTRENLIGTLREIDAAAGARVEVLLQETDPFSETARDARERFGISARQVPDPRSARAGFADVFLGVAVTCGAEEQVVPFFDRGLSAEYELARAIRVVARTERKRIGVVNTAAKLFGGMDFQTFQSSPPWPVVEELKKQYEVVQISVEAPITEALDGILVVLPSSLSQAEMDNLALSIEGGTPALLLVDPLPVIDTTLAPSERAGANQNPFMQQQQAPPKDKGNIEGLLARLGVSWNKGAIVWDAYNPHPDLAHLPDEVVFVGAGNENELAFNSSSRASDALQELVLLFPGQLEPGAAGGLEFEPLVRTGAVSGILPYQQMVRRTFFGSQVNTNLPHRADGRDYTVAARVRPAGSESADSSTAGVNLIVVADIDFISEQFFEIRKMGPASMHFDNVTFFLNAMDVLMGDESFIDLRNRRVRHRTLQRVEAQTRQFIEQRSAEELEAESEADNALAEAQRRLDQKVEEVRGRSDLDDQTKQIMARNLQEVESRRFDVLKANIETEKEAKIASSKENMESQIRRIQSGIRTFAVLFPPIPVFVLGVVIFFRRQRRAREGAAVAHRLRS